MARLKIRKLGDPVLRQTARPVTEINQRILTLLDDMAQTMRDADGCGLAAPQVGILRRIVVIETQESGLIELINPRIVATDGIQEAQEGCLSIPGKSGTTHRPMNVTVRALGRNGKSFEISGSGLIARAFCHEIDHLDGKLYIDIAENVTED